MPYVLLDDSSLSDIANAIRSRNKLVRTYKPREMAPAIRALKDLIPQSDGYEVRIAEYEHQKIKVRRYLNEEKTYTESFSSTKPFWKIQAEIEADPGYTPGKLNYPDELSVDRNIQISATPAEVTEGDDPEHIYWYVKGNSKENFIGWWWYKAGLRDSDGTVYVFTDEDCTRDEPYRAPCLPQGRPFQICHFIDKNDTRPIYMHGIFSSDLDATKRLNRAKEVVQNINTSGVLYMDRVLGEAPFIEYIDLSNFDVSSCESMNDFIYSCPRLKSIGDISHWNPQNLRTCNNFLGNVGLNNTLDTMDSLDVSWWNTPELRTASNFVGGKITTLDISNWDTSKITAFSVGNTMKYIIMDKEEVKFNGDYIMPNPNTTVKYLVPPTMLDDYKQHPNWQSRVSQIDDITKYTINRGGGQIFITPNI